MRKIRFEKPGTMLYPVPVVLVSCGVKKENYNIVTVAWVGTVNSEPPMLSISLRKSRYSYDLIRETGEFVVNLTTKELARATDYCGVKSGRDVDKFAETNLTPVSGDLVACPMVAESPLNIECKVRQIIELGSHDLFLADVVAVHADENLFDEAGFMDLEKTGLLTFSHGGYFGVEKRKIGGFGYSIMKPKTAKKRKLAEKKKK